MENHASTIGILGAGQLGRMLALAGIPLGMRFRFLDPSKDSPAQAVGELLVGKYEDESALERFASGLSLVTYEFENIPISAARYLSERVTVHPGVEALETAQDRLSEKELFHALGIPSARFQAINSIQDLKQAVDSGFPLPAVLKTRRLGYDGKGQTIVRSSAGLAHAWQELGQVPMILEEFVNFEGEVSLIAVRGLRGELSFYPLVQNVHHEGILATSDVPGTLPNPALQQAAERHVTAVLERFNYVGVLTVEFFVVQGKLLANEMAPRVHNSGHWTIEGAETSQFENHLRAISGLPLGRTEAVGRVHMDNIVGELPDVPSVLARPGAHLHLYGKEPRAKRKLGHITYVS